jgi:N-hydroxyarylamine O-acetyltransferase
MDDTEWPTQISQGRLSRANAEQYLKRLQLDPSRLLNSKPSLELLRQLQFSHITTVPFESTAIHVPNWHAADDTPIVLNEGGTVGLGQAAFERIVEYRCGGYCFSLNSTFALLLRYFGFRVSEVVARVFAHLGSDPNESGWDWSASTHQCALVDWEGSDGRYLVDVGFGSTQSLNPYVRPPNHQLSRSLN